MARIQHRKTLGPITFEGERMTLSRDDSEGAKQLETVRVGRFTVLSMRESKERNRIDGWERVFRVRAPRGLRSDGVAAAASFEWNGGCDCAHDCCGHYCGYVSCVKRAKRREWLVTVQVRFNY